MTILAGPVTGWHPHFLRGFSIHVEQVARAGHRVVHENEMRSGLVGIGPRAEGQSHIAAGASLAIARQRSGGRVLNLISIRERLGGLSVDGRAERRSSHNFVVQAGLESNKFDGVRGHGLVANPFVHDV